MKKKWIFIVLAFVVLFLVGGRWLYHEIKYNKFTVDELPEKQDLKKVVSVDKLQDNYDVIVVGTDPEGVSAAVSAARNGLKTLLIDGRDREILGGLMTIGWLNSIDMNWDNTKPNTSGKEKGHLNKGIFTEWYKQTEGHSFDVTTAANAFYDLVAAEENIDLFMSVSSIKPIVETQAENTSITGITITKSDKTEQNILAKAVIDATQDGDIAADAGVSFTIGREDIGDKDVRMAVTAVFRLKNIDDKAWKLIAKRLNGDGDPNTGVSKLSAWGYGEEMSAYVPVDEERTKMRGLNIGRQLDNTILINALHIFEIDGLDPKSRKEGLEIASKEVPNVVKFLKENFKEFDQAELDSIASELYVRETRHMVGLYRLSIIDLLEHNDKWDRIAFGSYPADIQRTSPSDGGAIVVHPIKYAIPFRSIVPESVDGLLVVGKAASYDTLAHGSARVIPVGMAEGQAAGAAVKLAIENNITFRSLAQSKPLIAELQETLTEQGMALEPFELEKQQFMKHKAFPGLRAAVYMGIAYGDYGREAFNLDNVSNMQRMVNQTGGVIRMYPSYFTGDHTAAVKGIKEPAEKPLSLQQACFTVTKALGLHVAKDKAQAELQKKGLLTKDTVDMIENKEELTDGDSYMILKDVVESLVGIQFDKITQD